MSRRDKVNLENRTMIIRLLFSFFPVLSLLLFPFPAVSAEGAPHSLKKEFAGAPPPNYSYEVINQYPHDPDAFTQGLVFDKGMFFESTGIRGKSSLRKITPDTGEIIQIIRLPNHLFGEGVTVFNEKVILLTWKAGIGLVFEKGSFKLIKEFKFAFEGWGITHDNRRLIISDGTSIIRFCSPDTLEEVSRIHVHDEKGPVRNLNELEFIKGEIFANIWRTEKIARISPETGRVVGWIDLTGLYSPTGPAKPVDVLNGIAYDSENDRLFLTGKLWPKIFEIRIVK